MPHHDVLVLGRGSARCVLAGRLSEDESLYVGDASVMPSIPRANTHLAVLGIAEKLAASL